MRFKKNATAKKKTARRPAKKATKKKTVKKGTKKPATRIRKPAPHKYGIGGGH
jgi:hypothetical protein